MKFMIYGQPNCVWCERSKALIERKGFTYTYLGLGVDFDLDELFDAFGDVKTFPQIAYNRGTDAGWEILGGYLALETLLE